MSTSSLTRWTSRCSLCIVQIGHSGYFLHTGNFASQFSGEKLGDTDVDIPQNLNRNHCCLLQNHSRLH